MKGFLWSRKSAARDKDNISTSTSSSSLAAPLALGKKSSNRSASNNNAAEHKITHSLRNSLSSSSLTSNHGNATTTTTNSGFSQYLHGRNHHQHNSRSQRHSSTSSTPPSNKKTILNNHNNSTSSLPNNKNNNSSGHGSNIPAQIIIQRQDSSSRESSNISSQFMRKTNSVSHNHHNGNKANSNFIMSNNHQSLPDLQNRSSISVLSNDTISNGNSDDIASIVSDEINPILINNNNNNNIDTVVPTMVNANSASNNNSQLRLNLNENNYDDTIFKTGWINKSHGQIKISNPNNSNNIKTISSSKRESRLFYGGSNEHLNITNTHNSNSSNNNSNSSIDNENTMMTTENQKIFVPDYRIYKAQLKGSVLSLYKSGMNNSIKYFDPNLSVERNDNNNNDNNIDKDNSRADVTTEKDSNFNYKRSTISGNLNTYSQAGKPVSRQHSNTLTKTKSNHSSTSQKNIKLSYLNVNFPHPDLKLDEKNRKILNGSVESLCHTILFFNKNDPNLTSSHINIFNLLLMLPLIDNFIVFLRTFNQLGLTFTKHSSKLTTNSTQFVNISKDADDLLTERLALTIKTILDIFPGFLLDDNVFQATFALLDTISLHDDEISNNLKILVANKHNQLSKLTYFIRPNSTDKNDNIITINNTLLEKITSGENFLHTDINSFANEIHQINLKFDRIWAPRSDYSLLYSSKYIDSNITALNPLVFNNRENVHFLGRLLISHLFPISKSTVDPKLRAQILVKWVQLGCKLEHLGDMVSWLTIATIICSIPILRLFESWQFVPESTLKIIYKDWVPTIIQLDRRQMSSKSTNSVFILAPPNLDDSFIRENVISYFGDLLVIVDNLPKDSTLKYIEKKIARTKNAFHKWQQRLETVDASKSLNKSDDNSENNVKQIEPNTSELYHFWKYHTTQPKLNIENIMKLSLEYEPPIINQDFYSKISSQRSPLITGSYLPIVFNELLPNYSLFSKSSLIGAAGNLVSNNNNNNNNSKRPPPRSSARLSRALTISSPIMQNNTPVLNFESNPITGIENIDGPAMKELISTQSTKQVLMKSIRDVFNIDTDTFHILNDLVFKSMMTNDDKIRPSSVVIESPKRFSQHSGNNTGNARDSVDTTGHLSKTLENLDFFKSISTTSDPLKETIINIVVKSASLDRMFDLLVLTTNIFSKLIKPKDLENYYYHQRKRNGTNTDVPGELVGLLDLIFVKLVMDNDVFTETFFNSYKSFTTTLSILENLAKRFIGARSCAYGINQIVSSDDISTIINGSRKFPIWDTRVPNDSQANNSYVLKIQIGTAEALLHLTTYQYNDFTDNFKCHTTMLDILKIMEQEISTEWPRRIENMKTSTNETNEQLPEIETLLRNLNEVFNNIKTTYQKQLYRPVGICKTQKKIMEKMNALGHLSFDEFHSTVQNSSKNDGFIQDFKKLEYDDYSGILNWVSAVDKQVASIFKLINKHDWLVTYEYLDLLTKSSLTSFFAYPLHERSVNKLKNGSNRFYDLEISNVFTWLLTLRISEKRDKIIYKLPKSIQLLLIMHSTFTSFFISQIIGTDKASNRRVDLFSVLLQILNYVRWKNASLDLFDTDAVGNINPHVPSFIETAICNSILRPESRIFEASWILASTKLTNNLNKPPASFQDILKNFDKSHIRGFLEIDNVYITNTRSLCPCPGWFISRLLDISQFVPNMDTSNSKLINFDKRRFVTNIISNISDLVPEDLYSVKSKKSEFQWGNILFNEVNQPSVTLIRQIMTSMPSEDHSEEGGLFHDIIMAEIEKIKREQRKFELLQVQERESKLPSQVNKSLSNRYRASMMDASVYSNESVTSEESSAVKKRGSVSSLSTRGNTISGGSNSGVGKKIGGFFRRPFSMAGFNTSSSNYSLNSALTQEAGGKKCISPVSLPLIVADDVDDSKPVLCLKTFEIKSVVEVINHKRNPTYIYSFKILMQDGAEHMLQARNSMELSEWIQMLKASKRYSFYSEKFKGKTHNKVFGVPLESICEREHTIIPTIIVKLLEEIELRGLDELGLYRIPGSVGSINALKNAFDEEGAVNNSFTLEDDRWFEINAIAGCFKMYLRELPESLFTSELIGSFSHISSKLQANEITYEQFKLGIFKLLSKLPTFNYQTLKKIVFHLNKVHQHVDNNRMDASNLAIVFSMSFIDQDDLANSMGSTLGSIQNILRHFIKNPADFFI